MTYRLKQQENEALEKCYSVKNAAGYSETAMRDMFQKGVEAANRWISVDNELPHNSSDYVLCKNEYGDLFICLCRWATNTWVDNNGKIRSDITDWRPIE